MSGRTLGVEEIREALLDACFNLRKAARVMTRFYDEALRPSGLRVTQFGLMMAILAIGVATVGELAEATVMDRTTVTRNLKPLEGSGLVRVGRGEDRRLRQVSLTGAGLEALSRAFPLWRQVQSELEGRLSQPHFEQLIRQARATVENLQS